MKIIIIKPYKTYKVNEIVELPDGFAKNFLIPKGYAQPVNKNTLANLERVKENISIDLQNAIEEANKQKEQIEALILNFSLKANKNIVHGSITHKAIIKELLNHNIKIDKRWLPENVCLNTFGTHYVPIKLHPQVIAKIRIFIEEEK